MNNLLTYIKLCAAGLGACLSTLLGGWDVALYVLIGFIIMDYVTGMTAAYQLKQLNSRTGFKGITKKIMLFIPIMMAVMLDRLINTDILRNLATWFYIANEGLSVLENLGKIGILVPPGIATALEQLRKKEV